MQASRFATPLCCIGPLQHSRVQKSCWLAPCDFFPTHPTPCIFFKLRDVAAMRALPLLGITRTAPTGRTGQGGSQMPPAPEKSLPPRHTHTHTRVYTQTWIRNFGRLAELPMLMPIPQTSAVSIKTCRLTQVPEVSYVTELFCILAPKMVECETKVPEL